MLDVLVPRLNVQQLHAVFRTVGIPAPTEDVNPKTGVFEYTFPPRARLPGKEGKYNNDGYVYTPTDRERIYTRQRKTRQRKDAPLAATDPAEEQELRTFFAELVKTYGDFEPDANERRYAVAIVQEFIDTKKWTPRKYKTDVVRAGLDDPRSHAMNRLQVLFQGMMQRRMQSAHRTELDTKWAAFCSKFDDVMREAKIGAPRRPPSGELTADPTITEEFRKLQTTSVAGPYTVEVEGTGDNSLVHRAEADIEIVGDVAYVRVYQTVYAPSLGDQKFKDVIQRGADKKVIIESVGAKAWLNMGRPVRAFHYVRTYQAQGVGKRKEALAKLDPKQEDPTHPKHEDYKKGKETAEISHGLPIIRTFLIPKSFHDEYTEGAISESQVEDLGTNRTLNVDKAKEPNQFGVRATDVKAINERILPGSLVSFVVEGEEHRYKDERHGKVLPMSQLAEWLHMPALDNPFMPAMRGTKVAKPEEQEQEAARLGALYDLACDIEKSKDWLARDQLVIRWNARAVAYGVRFPGRRDAIPSLLDELERAATFALVPSLIQENYEEFRERSHLEGMRERTGKPIELWTEAQRVPVTTRKKERDDEKVQSKVKDDDIVGRLGESAGPVIDLLIDYLGRGELVAGNAEHQEQITKVVTYILHVATETPLRGEDCRKPELFGKFKAALVTRLDAAVKPAPVKKDEPEEEAPMDLFDVPLTSSSPSPSTPSPSSSSTPSPAASARGRKATTRRKVRPPQPGLPPTEIAKLVNTVQPGTKGRDEGAQLAANESAGEGDHHPRRPDRRPAARARAVPSQAAARARERQASSGPHP